MQILFNSRLSLEEQERIRTGLQAFAHLKNHVWVATSGSSGCPKWVALSQEALHASAEAVNMHLQSNFKDCWLHALPDFHVGGLGIHLRAKLSGASVIDCKQSGKWDPEMFHQMAANATLTALVPTQIYDLVKAGLKAPESLRAIVVGGGTLDEVLYHKAVHLGWKLLPSYGLTECASQVATASLGSWEGQQVFPILKKLPHISLKSDSEGFLCIESPALLTGYALDGLEGFHFVDPKVDGWFQTEDFGESYKEEVTVRGRAASFVKIGGESVSLTRLNALLDSIKSEVRCGYDAALVAIPDERLGHVIQLVTTEEDRGLVECYQAAVLPFEQIKSVRVVAEISRSWKG
ncbi:MAG: AMP-binding protein [Parachlamydiaceae bacterium]|nr:AMP-binding protein [Parachlamydiaceae bacterium]